MTRVSAARVGTECKQGCRFSSAESMRRDEALLEERRGVLGTPRPPVKGEPEQLHGCRL